MNSDSNYDCQISSFAEYLNCDPKIVYDLYHEIDLDRISDLEKVTELKKT